MTSHIRFYDITQKIFLYHKIIVIFLYHKIEFVISLNHGGFLVSHFFLYIYITKSIFYTKNQVYFFISQNRFCDIKNRFGYIKFDFVISQSGGFIVAYKSLSGLYQ